jgi:hypothetical protein
VEGGGGVSLKPVRASTLNIIDFDNGYDAPIHAITLRNSLIENVHDGLEVNLDAYDHVYITGNEFDNELLLRRERGGRSLPGERLGRRLAEAARRQSSRGRRLPR